MRPYIFTSAIRAFFAGIGSMLDFSGGTYYLPERRATEVENLQGDWRRIGSDLRQAEAKTRSELEETRKNQLSLALDDV